MSQQQFSHMDELLQIMSCSESKADRLYSSVELANEVMRIVFPATVQGETWAAQLLDGRQLLNKYIPHAQFSNSKTESWFEQNPAFRGERVALIHFSVEDAPIESKFYWLNSSATKARISAGTMITPNWEDSTSTKHPQFKVGINFFLSSKADELYVVVSDSGRLRLLDLTGKLSNTQKEILDNFRGAAGLTVAGSDMPQAAIHTQLWEAMALKEVNRKFYIGIAEHFNLLYQHLTSVSGGAHDEQDSKLFANRLIGRLLFLRFLHKKGFIDDEMGYFNDVSTDSARYYETHLKPLFFATLNKPVAERQPINGRKDESSPYLNGGLFEAHGNDWVNEKISFPENWFVDLYDHFDQFNFTTDESTPEYEQVAIDPEMLGRVFENLLAAQLTETGEVARKASGSYYTPREIVSYICRETLRQFLYRGMSNEALNPGIDLLLDMDDAQWTHDHSNARRNLWGEGNTKTVVPAVISLLDSFTVLDPACGSGAFPMGMLQLLLRCYERLDSRFDVYKTKLKIIEKNISGVDIQPMAVEISRLRAWLSAIVDEPDVKQVKPLPNLDFKFVCANSLVPLQTDEKKQIGLYDLKNKEAEDAMLIKMENYMTISDHEERAKARGEIQNYWKDLGDAAQTDRGRKLAAWADHLFDFDEPAPFFAPEIMLGVTDGFDAVIGNPPYIHLEDMKEQSKSLYQPLGYQTYEARGDIYSLFYERGFQLLKDGGVLCYITSNKWMRAAYGESLRKFLSESANPVSLIDFAGQKIFDATVDTNILLATKMPNATSTKATIVKEDCIGNLSVYIKQHAVDCHFEGGESWTILSPIEQSIKRKIEAVGKPLKEWDIQINYGIKTGCNEAFIIDGATKDRLIAEDPKSAEIIRPILRGRDIRRYSYDFHDKWLIASHNGYTNDDGLPVPRIDMNDYPAVKAHLDKYWDVISARSDRGKTPYNLRNCAYMDDLNKPKIVWGEISDKTKFAIDNQGKFAPEATAFLLTGPDLKYLLGYLNSSFSEYLFSTTGTTTGVGTVRWKKYKIEQLLIPQPSINQRQSLESLIDQISVTEFGTKNYRELEMRINEQVFTLVDLNSGEANFILDKNSSVEAHC